MSKLLIEFATAILHGDEEHRAWLLASARTFAVNRTVLPVAGKGRKDAEIAALTTKLTEAEAMLTVKPTAMEYADQTQRISELEAENERLKTGLNKGSDYAIELQRLIEAFCHGRELPTILAMVVRPMMMVSAQ